MALFDRFVIVDWSASAIPRLGPDSIWTCVLDASPSAAPVLENHATRHRAERFLTEVLLSTSGRVLMGADVSYGYPRGFAAAAGLDGVAPWRATWDHLAAALHDDEYNRNDRFEVAAALNARVSDGAGPLWGTTSERHVAPTLSRRKAPGFPHITRTGHALVEHRATELALRADGRRPGSTWQLAGVGSVGSQALTAIPVLTRLRDHPNLVARSHVWPFETGLTTDPTCGRADAIVHVEIWPSAVPLDTSLHPVKDAAQVFGLAARLRELDADGVLGARFAPDVPGDDVEHVLAEEGWILDVTDAQRHDAPE